MKPIERAELLDLGAYEQIRQRFMARVIEQKRARYVALGPNMTVLFENRDTVLMQIQEMLRTERITAEKAIEHELETYNELVPGDSELSATIFIEYPDREQRERMLSELRGVDDKFFVEAAGERVPVVPDRRGTDPNRTMAVHYVKFSLTPAALGALESGRGPVSIGVDHASYQAKTELSAATLRSLQDDFER
ncbi:MAG TPA: DUF3501 family protein [Polyangiaceae bacterium]|nr:DUF3501 family protein [Polyangiaceae bacterium]